MNRREYLLLLAAFFIWAALLFAFSNFAEEELIPDERGFVAYDKDGMHYVVHESNLEEK